jgi:Sugar efflux transporter for intercellular exchange
MVTSCFVWIVYGILKNEPIIWGTNAVEFILSIYYFVEFTVRTNLTIQYNTNTNTNTNTNAIQYDTCGGVAAWYLYLPSRGFVFVCYCFFLYKKNYAPKQSPTFPGSVHRHIQLCVATWIVSIVIILFFANKISAIGDLTVLLSIVTFASPLVAAKSVFESQSSDSIPWPFTLAALLNCTLWTVVGIFDMHDGYVAAPEILGLFLTLLQIALKLYYGEHAHGQDNPSYMRASTTPVEMPYPVLGSVRSVVMLGNNNNNHNNNFNPFHERFMEHHDLQLDMNGAGGGDYVELGVPLTGGGESQHPHASTSSVTHPSLGLSPLEGGSPRTGPFGSGSVHHRGQT